MHWLSIVVGNLLPHRGVRTRDVTGGVVVQALEEAMDARSDHVWKVTSFTKPTYCSSCGFVRPESVDRMARAPQTCRRFQWNNPTTRTQTHATTNTTVRLFVLLTRHPWPVVSFGG